jgi:DNA repair exonuclease SbcCD ATPase subunit
VTAAHVTWRPLGALLVEKGLLTAEELEDALAAQQTTGKRLGQILIDRGHVSGPALTNALAEQYGIELKTEEGFGTGLRAEIERRHTTRRPPVAPEEAPAGPAESPAATETNGNGAVEEVHDHLPGDVPLAELEPQLEEHWARLAAAEASVAAREAQIAELEAEVAALERRLAESQAGPELEDAPELDVRAAELADRERDLLASLEQIAAASARVAERERELAEHEQVLEGRQRAILTAAADLEQRRKSVEEREGAPAVPAAAEVRELVAPQPERPEPADGARWNLDTLTRLVEESAHDFPDRADDWRFTLFYLRNEAHIDGTLPCRFDSLVEECFGELVGTGDRAPLAASVAV